MLLFQHRPGESLVIQTPNGPVVVQFLDGQAIGVEAPPGTEVLQAEETARGGDWLPARPDRASRLAT